ncbi:outer membrane protein [Terrihabitans sp. B22-R8]|uniref:outer membrane protein n=1 Tax=Terrihabitans sp. B22-R8 TaxID=3425128 RepID=UPI00403CE627
MKNILLAGAALVALSTASFAADMPVYPAEAAVAPVAETNDWGGFYLGIQGGYSWVDGDVDDALFAGSAGLDDDGFLVGIYSGYNRQFGDWVFGIDNSISYVDVTAGFGGGAGEVEINTLATTRGRIGYSFGNFLVFGAGGIALAHTETRAFAAEDDHLQVGWTAGAGIEAKLGGNWSARVEYIYADFDDERYTLADGDGVSAADVSYDMSVVRGGIAYHF